MSSPNFEEQAALALAPSFRERFDFSSEEQWNLWADQTWKAARVLASRQPASLPSEVASPDAAKKGSK